MRCETIAHPVMSVSPQEVSSRSQSQSSLSPSASHHQYHSRHDDVHVEDDENFEIPLETLVSHLLSAKRALSSINTVWRANEIVTSARSALEESVILRSRSGFLQRGIEQQTRLLKKVKTGVENVYKEGQQEFEVCLLTILFVQVISDSSTNHS